MEKTLFLIPQSITGKEVREARHCLGLSQQDFARLLGCSKPTVTRWETGKNSITGPIVFAVYEILHKNLKDEIILPKMKYRLRLIYMYRSEVCTVLDVDDINEKLEIHNYQDNINFRAFGSNLTPTYQEYNDFLESRCFPRTRDKMKLELEKLDLPFYDPMMIIEKTEGRMAEDDFWIKVERK